MRIVYSTTFVAICPADGSTDIYELEVVSDHLIPVESILAVIQLATRKPHYQEQITSELAARLEGAAVTTRGVHSGVRTEVEC